MRRDLTQAKELARRLDQGTSEQVYNFSRRTPKKTSEVARPCRSAETSEVSEQHTLRIPHVMRDSHD